MVVVDKAAKKMPLSRAMALDASEKEDDMCVCVCFVCTEKSVERGVPCFLVLSFSLSLSFAAPFFFSRERE